MATQRFAPVFFCSVSSLSVEAPIGCSLSLVTFSEVFLDIDHWSFDLVFSAERELLWIEIYNFNEDSYKLFHVWSRHLTISPIVLYLHFIRYQHNLQVKIILDVLRICVGKSEQFWRNSSNLKLIFFFKKTRYQQRDFQTHCLET